MALVCLGDMIADLRQNNAVYLLHRQTAIPYHLVRGFQTDRPQAEAEHTVSFNVFVDPVLYPRFVKGVG